MVQSINEYQMNAIQEVGFSWITINNRELLRFDFFGSLEEESASSAIKRWEAEFQRLEADQKVDLIWNCLEMNHYTAKSARLWKRAMDNMNQQINRIWLITDNTFMKLGAKTITFLFPVELKVIASEAEIK